MTLLPVRLVRRPAPLDETPALQRRLVIDTQSVLDWHFFHDPVCSGWDASIASGRWRWIASSAMRDELAQVLARGFGARWPGDGTGVLGAFDARAELRPAPRLSLAMPLRCSDPDDQKFIDLAIAEGACTLISRDKALLKLARRAASLHGVCIVPPAQWAPECVDG